MHPHSHHQHQHHHHQLQARVRKENNVLMLPYDYKIFPLFLNILIYMNGRKHAFTIGRIQYIITQLNVIILWRNCRSCSSECKLYIVRRIISFSCGFNQTSRTSRTFSYYNMWYTFYTFATFVTFLTCTTCNTSTKTSVTFY